MKITLACITITITVLFIEESSPYRFQQDKTSVCNSVGLWHQGKVAYEISNQFVKDDLNVIRDSLVEIMNTTCIKFVPHTNEPDYVVFLKYKHPTEGKRTCWSGNQWNNGTSTVGNKKGRHLVSLWQDLECFNKLDIIREIFNILGFQAKSSTLISTKNRGSIIYGAYLLYEEVFNGTDKQKQSNSFLGPCINETSYLKKFPYAFDKKQRVSIARKDSCSIVQNMKQINRIYNCPEGNFPTNIALDYARPNCKAEAEKGACQTDSVYISSIGCNIFCSGWGISHGIPSPRRANLINGLGKCFGEDSDNYLYQWDCNPSNDAMLWSWNQVSLGSRDRHICNGGGFCVASPSNVDYSIHLSTFYHLDEHAQRFYFSDSLAHPGFYVIQNDYGKCLSVNGNTNQTRAQIWANDCNPSEAGQRWKWL